METKTTTSLSVVAYLGGQCFTYTFEGVDETDARFGLTEWLQWEGGDFDRVLVDGVEVA